ncbi:unnamed protein product [Schistosoma curassoni]|uniref:Transcriptional regulator n=1 Tax=Schistosoma curassoni TaxID=6186 RepID=A0A183L5S1_9TREM|nr:unnamed protein product [Schistosoma curassoni]
MSKYIGLLQVTVRRMEMSLKMIDNLCVTEY